MSSTQKSYSFLVTGIILFLFIPLLQTQFQIVKNIKPLFGAYVPAPDTTINTHDWFSGQYQEIKDKYITQNFGLRNYYVRLNNQIDYKLFKVANIDKVIVGKGDFLYETDYIEAYYGNNFLGVDELTKRYKKVKELQDLLATMGIDLEIALLPSKASFYPEYIPENQKSEFKATNYDCAALLCKKLKIHAIDFSAWFKSLKTTTPYELYPKCGIHWGGYGALIAADSLRKQIEYNTKLNLRDFVITHISYTDSIMDPDNDMGIAMNLLKDIKTLPMPLASYYWTEDPNAVKPKALFIGDSYFWNIYTQGLTNNLFTEGKFWYYNQTVYPESEPVREVSKLNLADEIKKQQVIVIMATEINAHDMGWGFVDKALEALSIKGSGSARQRIYVNNIQEHIKNTPEWMTDIKKKAAERKISEEEMIKLDAIYIYETEYARPEVVALIEKGKERIRNTKEWIEQVKVKAKEKNISEEEMLELDAKYLYDTEIKNK